MFPAIHRWVAGGVLAPALAVLGCGGSQRRPLAAVGTIEVNDGFAFPSIGGGAAAFVTVRNRGRRPDTLVGVESPVASLVTLHGVAPEHGVVRMVHVPTVVVESGATVAMKSGGLHLMMAGVDRDFGPGDSCRLVLLMARAGRIAVTVPVVKFGDRP